jgi:hypothetical protein
VSTLQNQNVIAEKLQGNIGLDKNQMYDLKRAIDIVEVQGCKVSLHHYRKPTFNGGEILGTFTRPLWPSKAEIHIFNVLSLPRPDMILTLAHEYGHYLSDKMGQAPKSFWSWNDIYYKYQANKKLSAVEIQLFLEEEDRAWDYGKSFLDDNKLPYTPYLLYNRNRCSRSFYTDILASRK